MPCSPLMSYVGHITVGGIKLPSGLYRGGAPVALLHIRPEANRWNMCDVYERKRRRTREAKWIYIESSLICTKAPIRYIF